MSIREFGRGLDAGQMAKLCSNIETQRAVLWAASNEGPPRSPGRGHGGGDSMSEPDPTVFVVDDDPSVCRSIGRLIGGQGFSVETFASARSFLDAARVEGPACLVLDVRLPGLSGLDLQQELVRSEIAIPIIFITGHGNIPMTVRAMKAGAVEFLTKPFRSRDLLQAVRAAIERDRLRYQAWVEVGAVRERYERLTPREREVMALVVAGLLNKQIAGELSLAERTVKFHRAHIVEKMQADSLAELVRMADQLGVGPGRGAAEEREER
jgi:FixJ family two-component response regulator